MSTQFSDALVFIRHHQDGEIAEKMRNSGLQYNMIYGVSSVLLADYANQRGRNQALADLLWEENFREAKLMAFMFADFEQIPDNIVEQYVQGCTNNEMVEIAVKYLFALLPNSMQLVKRWIQSDNRYVKMSGYLLLARLAVIKKINSENDLIEVLKAYEHDLISSDYFISQSVQKAFQEIAFRYQNFKSLILEKTQYICESNKDENVSLKVNEMLQILKYC